MAGGAVLRGAERSERTLRLGSKLSSVAPLGKHGSGVDRLDDKAGFKWVREALARTREALETLRETEQLHRLLFEKVPHPRFVCDAETLRILVVNEAAVRKYGYSRGQFLRMRVTDLSAPD